MTWMVQDVLDAVGRKLGRDVSVDELVAFLVKALRVETELQGTKEIAPYLGRSERTVRTWIAEKGLPVYKLGGRLVASPSALQGWLDTHKVHASASPG